ncbi:MAG: hypothetical protein NTW87_05460 [Planctomycetota bacterium]|nr:hypothetical protein [Planctomycetota bacterium]
MLKPISLLAVLAACWAAISAVVAGEKDAGQTIRPYVSFTGADSHIKQPGYHRIVSEAEWLALWQKHKGAKESSDYSLFYNPLGLPHVDFDQCMVIALCQGAGYNSAGVEAVSVTEEKDRIVFRFNSKSYQTVGPPVVGSVPGTLTMEDGGGQAVAVYGFFVLPRSTKAVILQENVQRTKAGPPEWQERASFGKLGNTQ